MKTLKSFRYISVSLIIVSLLLFTLACGGDSDDGDSDGTGGSSTATGGSTGGTTDNGSGGTTTATGGSSGGDMDAAAQLDGADPLPTDVAEGGECTLGTILFTATGTCQSSSDCPGGLPTQFDISGIGIDPMIATLLAAPDNDQANCASGLTCCINTDQCVAVGNALAGNGMVQEFLGDSVSALGTECVSPGSCTAKSEDNSFGEIPTGCEAGQSCCVNVPPITLPEADGSTPAADAGAATADASAES